MWNNVKENGNTRLLLTQSAEAEAGKEGESERRRDGTRKRRVIIKMRGIEGRRWKWNGKCLIFEDY